MSSDRCIPVFNLSSCCVDCVLDLNLISVLETPDQFMWNVLLYFSRLNHFDLNEPGLYRLWHQQMLLSLPLDSLNCTFNTRIFLGWLQTQNQLWESYWFLNYHSEHAIICGLLTFSNYSFYMAALEWDHRSLLHGIKLKVMSLKKVNKLFAVFSVSSDCVPFGDGKNRPSQNKWQGE